jgi:ribonuclease P protein component
MARRQIDTPAGRLRRLGVRASHGPWTLCAEKASAGRGRLMVSLGRAAGGAATRSRIRRIARDVFEARRGRPAGVDLLLLARSDVSFEPRSEVRARLGELLGRVSVSLARREARGAGRG